MKPMILCGQCHKPIVADARFCSHCGSAVEWSSEARQKSAEATAPTHCRSCGAENDPSSRICIACGSELAAVTKARLSASHNIRKKKKELPPLPQWKMMAGLAAFLAIGVLSLQLLTAKKLEGIPQQAEERPAVTAPNMQALPQIEEMEQRLAANPKDEAQLLQLANLLHDSHFYDKAVQRYKEYLGKHDNNVDARVDLGICFYEMDRTGDAKQEMTKALKSNPDHVLGNFNLGIVNLRIAQAAMSSGNTEQATQAIKEANESFRKTSVLDPNGSAGQRAQRLLTEHGQTNKLPTN